MIWDLQTLSPDIKLQVGDMKGCVHLVALLTAMAPAAFQGVYSGMDRKYKDPEVVEWRMENTCWVWRTDGPLMNLIKDAEN